MGYGAWDDDTYLAAATYRRAAGADDFGYDATLRGSDPTDWKAAPVLNPYGLTVRESRDSADHPRSTPIAIFFDVTGSMGTVPRLMQRRLADLHGLLTRGGYCEDPQILFGAVGDEAFDRVPLQIGQFESDNRMDEQLRQIFIEGGGGGDIAESYALAAYAIARHTATDSWDKRGRKGYLFIVGDEMNKPRLSRRAVASVLGATIETHLAISDLYAELQRRWNVYFVLPRGTSYYDDDRIATHWRNLLGQRFLKLDDPDAVCDLIAVTIGVNEDSIDLAEGLADLADTGRAASVGNALAVVAGTGRGGTVVAALPTGLAGPDDLLPGAR